ncbi:hypothetical protein KBB48_00775 [Candidatus Shapirobacteria bacterium]|nr:hypothetical protein [Candidatus Shapirobacteria bacterium]
MEIPNLSQNPITTPLTKLPAPSKSSISLRILALVLILSLGTGFAASRLFPSSGQNPKKISLPGQEVAISTDDIKDKTEIQAGKIYGDTATVFKDGATGTIEKGSINGVGTHILNREGGVSQRASLTSSVVDLDLFVDRQVEVKGETNASNKTAWLLDVGSVKVLE